MCEVYISINNNLKIRTKYIKDKKGKTTGESLRIDTKLMDKYNTVLVNQYSTTILSM